MKKFVLFFGFFLARCLSGEEYQLPVGRNFENMPVQLGIQIAGPTHRVSGTIDYKPEAGPLKDIVREELQKLALTYVPKKGEETEQHWLMVYGVPVPFFEGYFNLQKTRLGWRVPSGAFDAKFEYGAATSWKLQGVTGVSMRLYQGSEEVKYYSTDDGVGGDSPCQIGAAQSQLTMGWCSVAAEYGYPWLKESWWDSGNVTIEGFDGSATFDILDGHMTDCTEPKPAFLAQLVKPVVTPRITGVVPKADGSIEIRVYGDSVPVNVETLSADGWVTVSPAVGGQGLEMLADGTRGVVFHPDASASSGFFRLRPNTGLKASPPK